MGKTTNVKHRTLEQRILITAFEGLIIYKQCKKLKILDTIKENHPIWEYVELMKEAQNNVKGIKVRII